MQREVKSGKVKFLAKTLVVGVVVLLVMVGLLFFRFDGNYESDRLADGSRLRMYRLQHGREIFIHDGSTFQWLVRSLIPTNGYRFGPLRVPPPGGERKVAFFSDSLLCFELDAVGGNEPVPMLATPAIYGEHRGLFLDANGFAYPQDFVDTDRARFGDFGMFVCSSYPRWSERLDFRIQQRSVGSDTWRTLTTLQFPNPDPVRHPVWNQSQEVRSAEAYGRTFTLDRVEIWPDRKFSPDLFVPELMLKFSVTGDSGKELHWWVPSLRVEDVFGNGVGQFGSWFHPGLTVGTHGRAIPDPTSIWKVTARFQRTTPDGRNYSLQVGVPSLEVGTQSYQLAGLPLTLRRVARDRVRILVPDEGADLMMVADGFVSAGREAEVCQPVDFRRALSSEGGEGSEMLSYSFQFEEADESSLMLSFTPYATRKLVFYVVPQIFGDPRRR